MACRIIGNLDFQNGLHDFFQRVFCAVKDGNGIIHARGRVLLTQNVVVSSTNSYP